MKKIFLSLFFFLLSCFVGAVGYSAYEYYQALHIDDPIDPYIWTEVGQSTVIRGEIANDIPEKNRFSVREGDTIITLSGSEVTLFWPDRSVTRIGENSKFVIQTMRVATDYSKIEIEAALVEGKVYSNITRTLYPGSHITVNLPSEKIIAGVRGTEFSINLEKGYIHSVDHAVAIKKKLLNLISQDVSVILPGEIISVANIFEKLTKEILDTSWETFSQLQNNEYITAHAEQISLAWNKISGEFAKNNYWDILVRKILSYFDAFQDLEITKQLRTLDFSQIEKISKESFLKWYQTMKFGDFAKERDFIRGAVFELSKIDQSLQNFLETFATESLWDLSEFPALDLEKSFSLLQNAMNTTELELENFMKDFSKKDYSSEIINSVQKLFILP